MGYQARQKRYVWKCIVTLGLLVLLQLVMPESAAAMERDIVLDSTTEEITMTCGDTGKFILGQELVDSYNENQSDDVWDSGTWDSWDWFFNGVKGDGFYNDGYYDESDGSYDGAGDGIVPPDTENSQQTIAAVVYSSSDTGALEVAEDGTYTAKLGKDVILYITAYNTENNIIYSGSFKIVVKADLSAAVLSETSHTEYWFDNTKLPLSFKVTVNGAKGLPSSGGNAEFEYNISPYTDMECSFSGNEITVSAYALASATIEIKLDNKTFSLKINIKRVSISGSNSLYLVKGRTKQLKLKGTSQKTVWTSSNPSVVKITKNGKMKGKKTGNAVITAKTGSGKTGCVVSVVTAGRLKVLKRAVWIGRHWKYDQQKRMQDGYYDCSALVWKAYLKEKKYIMSKNYAPTSADLGKWCATHGKIIKGSNSKNLAKLKMKPGAVMFETGSDNGRYKGIYHVEMFTGYTFEGYDYNGKPLTGTKWANRPDNYYGSGDLWAQL